MSKIPNIPSSLNMSTLSNIPTKIPNLSPKIENPIFQFVACKLYDKIQESIKEFEKKLNEDEAIQLHVILNDGSKVDVRYMGCRGASLLIFGGKDENNLDVEALISQNNFQMLITKVKLRNDEEKVFIEFLDSFKETASL